MHGFEKEHKRFWRQVILWLVKRDVTTPDYFGGALILLLATRLIPARRHRQSPPDRRAEIAPAPARA